MTVYLVTRCEAGHEHHVELLRATQDEHGTWSGYAGSAADFCETCDEPCEVVHLTHRSVSQQRGCDTGLSPVE